jgi:hypothetical protein
MDLVQQNDPQPAGPASYVPDNPLYGAAFNRKGVSAWQRDTTTTQREPACTWDST